MAQDVRSAGRAGSGGARQAGERAPTIRDVAASAGMSLVTVSRVINDHPSVKPSSRARVERAMEELNYFPDASAQRLRSGSSRTVGFLMPDFTNGVNVVIAQEVEQAMQRAGYTVLLACSNFDPQVEIEALRKFHANRVDGIVLQTCSETHEGILETLARVRCPVVLVDRDMAVEADAVCSNHYDATREATRYLIGLGHEEIGFITANATMRPGRERHRGFVDEMAAHALVAPPRRVFVEAQSIAYGLSATRQMLSERRPSAIIAAGNQIVYGAIQGIRESGLDFPGDVSLVGADHRMLSIVMRPRLTMMERELTEIGVEVASLLLDRVCGRYDDAPRCILLPQRVVLNESCATNRRGDAAVCKM